MSTDGAGKPKPKRVRKIPEGSRRLCIYLSVERMAKLGPHPSKRIRDMIDLLPADGAGWDAAPKRDKGRRVNGRMLTAELAREFAAKQNRIKVVDVKPEKQNGEVL